MLSWKGKREASYNGKRAGGGPGGSFEMSFSLSQRVMKEKWFNDFKGLIMVLTSSRCSSDDINTVIILMWAFD